MVFSRDLARLPATCTKSLASLLTHLHKKHLALLSAAAHRRDVSRLPTELHYKKFARMHVIWTGTASVNDAMLHIRQSHELPAILQSP